MSFPTFKDFDKSAADVLGKDFDSKYNLEVKSVGPFNTTLTANTELDKENKLIPKLALKWVHNSGFTLEKFETTQDSKLTVETSLSNAAPGLKLDFKANDTDKADLLFTYKHALATVTGEVDVHAFSSAKLSVLGGNGPVTAGASADVKINGKSVVDSTTVNLGLGYTAPKFFVGVRAEKNFTNFSALASYKATDDVTVVAKAAQVKDLTATVGAVYKCNPDTTIKAKVTTNGTLSASVKQAFEKKFTVTGSAEIPSSLSGIKFGVNATLG